MDHLKYVPGLLEYSLTVQYATSILHVHGCPGKQTDEGYRMMYVTLILNTALSYYREISQTLHSRGISAVVNRAASATDRVNNNKEGQLFLRPILKHSTHDE